MLRKIDPERELGNYFREKKGVWKIGGLEYEIGSSLKIIDPETYERIKHEFIQNRLRFRIWTEDENGNFWTEYE